MIAYSFVFSLIQCYILKMTGITHLSSNLHLPTFWPQHSRSQESCPRLAWCWEKCTRTKVLLAIPGLPVVPLPASSRRYKKLVGPSLGRESREWEIGWPEVTYYWDLWELKVDRLGTEHFVKAPATVLLSFTTLWTFTRIYSIGWVKITPHFNVSR
jgi:hypothetical protein